jgi:glycosyltransferase involved in cell wall biosynthesis
MNKERSAELPQRDPSNPLGPAGAKKVLFITRKWPPAVGGMETYCRELTEELAKSVDLKLYVLPGRPGGLPPTFVSILQFGARTVWALLRERRSYDVIHGADMAIWPLVAIGGLTSPRATLVLSAHGTDVSFGDRSGILSCVYRVSASLGARLLHRAAVIANSKATAERVESLGYKQISVVPLAARVAHTAKSVSAINPKPYVLFVGRHYEKRKGLNWFIKEVLPLLPDELSLYIASPLRGVADARSFPRERVRLLGAVRGKAMDAFMAEAVCVVVPNIPAGEGHFEGFGLVAVEAAAAGGIVLASRIDGFTESIVNGVTGFLLPPNNSSTWAQAIIKVASASAKSRRAFIEKSQQKCQEYFTWERVAEDTLRAYDGYQSPGLGTESLL